MADIRLYDRPSYVQKYDQKRVPVLQNSKGKQKTDKCGTRGMIRRDWKVKEAAWNWKQPKAWIAPLETHEELKGTNWRRNLRGI
jgi:hypothetical protein